MRVLIVLGMFMSVNLQAAEDVWERKNFSKEYDSPFIFFAIFGVENTELTLSREKHNINEYPQGLDIRFYNKDHSEEQKEYIDGFLQGTFGELLKKELPILFGKTQKANNLAIVSGNFNDSNSLHYLKNSIGVIKALTEKGAVSVLDVQTSQFYTPEDWVKKYFEPRKPQPHNHVVILYSENDEGLWVHTRGMRTFGRPDISLVGWPKDKMTQAQELVNRFIEMYAFGALPEEGKEIIVKGLPLGLRTKLGGNYENLDFNNYFVEVKWAN